MISRQEKQKIPHPTKRSLAEQSGPVTICLAWRPIVLCVVLILLKFELQEKGSNNGVGMMGAGDGRVGKTCIL